ncbi:BglG family transcription antiterminator [Amedibacillus sp. YH-ame6]
MIEAISEKTIKLLLKCKEPITSKEIAKEIGMSESSVKHNMKEVRAIISSCHATLNSISGKGLLLECSEEQKNALYELIDEQRDKATSFNYRRNYILKILFQGESDYTIQIFADDLGVGKNVVIKDLESIEKWLGFFDISLIRIRNRGVMIEGKEFDIRQAIIYNNSSLMDNMEMDLRRPDDLDFRVSKTFYNYFRKIYSDIDIYHIQNLLLKEEHKLDYHFEDVSFIQLMEYICVSIYRIKEYHVIKEHTLLHSCRVVDATIEAAKHLLYSEIQEDNIDLKQEIRCMAAEFTLYGAYEDALSDSFLDDEIYEQTARQFLDYLQNIIMNRKILVNKNLINDITLLFKKKKMQKSYQTINSNYLKYDVKQQLPSLYGIVLANVETLETSLHVKFTENDIVYIVMLIDNAIEDVTDELSILMITSFDENTATYLKNKIRRSISNIAIKDTIHPEDFKEEYVDTYDIVLTTVLMEQENVLKISRRVDSYDLDLIAREVEHKQRIKQKILTRSQQLFNEDLICFNFKAKRKEDIFEKGVKLLSQQGYTTEKFYDILMQRENFISTAIGNGVAIPHGYKKEIYRSGVAVFKLDRPIDWNEKEKVEIVFIIAVELEDPKEIYEFFAKFYALIDDQQRLQQILHARNKHDIFLAIEDIGELKR